MCAPPPPLSADDPPPPEDGSAARLAMLRELAGIGMAVARAVGRQAEAIGGEAGEAAEARPAGAGDLALAFTRISRAVRLTLALEARIETEGLEAAREARRVREQAARAKAAVAQWRIGERMERLETALQGVIDVEARGEAAERLYETLDERLDEVLEDEILEQPFAELVVRICRDLGLAPDWRLWDDQDWFEEAGGMRGLERMWEAAAVKASTPSTPEAPPAEAPPLSRGDADEQPP